LCVEDTRSWYQGRCPRRHSLCVAGIYRGAEAAASQVLDRDALLPAARGAATLPQQEKNIMAL
jgi:hypothetical protein